MIIKRLLTLEAVILLGLGSVAFMPTRLGLGPAGIELSLPATVGKWTSAEVAVTPKELAGLAPDTGFARRMYSDAEGDEVYVSIVLSGADMANSIHRPERCLSAQGWSVERSDRIDVPMPNGGAPLRVTKLTNVREARLSRQSAPISVQQLDYYWFIGSRDVTPSHWIRTFIDIKDRVLYGENQRWAYVTFASTVTDNLQLSGRSQEETSRIIQDFIAQLAPQFQRPGSKT